MESQSVEPPRIAGADRATALLLILNFILLGGLLYAMFGRSLIPGDGVSLVIVNETLSPMADFKLSYPGGNFEIPQLDSKRSVGNPIPISGAFEAVLTFADEAGVRRTLNLPIKPLDEFLIVIHVFPELEESLEQGEPGDEPGGVRILPGRYRVVTTYQGENASI